MRPILVLSILMTLLSGCTVLAQPALSSTATALASTSLEEDTLRVHFIDVGNGFAALIETPGGMHILIDGGKSGKSEFKEYLNHFVGDDPIDILIVTHADADHFYNLYEHIEQYDVHQYWNTGYTSSKLESLAQWPHKFLGETIPALEAKGMVKYVPLEDYVEPGEWETIDTLGTLGRSDDVEVQFLNVDKQPPSRDSFSNRRFNESEQRNNASLVFKIEYMGTSFLFTGDINGRDIHDMDIHAIDSEEAELIELADNNEYVSLESTVLQVAHHGGNGSSSLPFLEAVNPEWAVIPVGKNRYNHPHPHMLDRLESVIDLQSQVLQTNQGGGDQDPPGDDSFIFIVDENGIRDVLWVRVE